MHAECVDEPLCDEDGGVYPYGRFCGRDEGSVECRERRDKRCTCETVEARVNEQAGLRPACSTPDTSCHRDLAEQVKPAGYPRCKCGLLWLGEHSGPEIGAAACWMCAANFCPGNVNKSKEQTSTPHTGHGEPDTHGEARYGEWVRR